MSEICTLQRGDGPLVISVPHAGTQLPQALRERMTDAARALVDTDWEVDRLYPFARELDATMLVAQQSRYVIDLNRDPQGTSLYPGARTTALCPTETFEGEPIYVEGGEPNDREIAQRRAAYWEPYHDGLQEELRRVRAAHGYALLLDAHSIWGRLPLLFEGELPDVNLGTNSGRSCDPEMLASVLAVVAGSTYSHVVDGRFKGGYITRRYGSPAHEVHGLQIELNQRTYLIDGSRTSFDERKASTLRTTLRAVCEAMLAWGARAERVRPTVLE
jgi:N-formylglutamate amidohydrolase